MPSYHNSICSLIQLRSAMVETLVKIVGSMMEGQLGDTHPEVMPHRPSTATTGAPTSGCERWTKDIILGFEESYYI